MEKIVWVVAIGGLIGFVALFVAQSFFPYSRIGRGIIWASAFVLTPFVIYNGVIA